MIEPREDIAITVFNYEIGQGLDPKDAAKIAWQAAKEFARAQLLQRLKESEYVEFKDLEVGATYSTAESTMDFEVTVTKIVDDSTVAFRSKALLEPNSTMLKKDFLKFDWLKVVNSKSAGVRGGNG